MVQHCKVQCKTIKIYIELYSVNYAAFHESFVITRPSTRWDLREIGEVYESFFFTRGNFDFCKFV